MSSSQERVRQVLIWGGAIFFLAMAYGSGMRARTKALQNEYEQVKVFKQEARLAQMKAQATEAQVDQLEARRLLDVAQDALTHNDKDSAQKAVAEAVTRLRTAQTADAANTADFTGMIDDIAHLDVTGANPDTVKQSLNGFAHAMDEKLAQAGGMPAPDQLTPITIKPPTDNDKPTLRHEITPDQ
jgi:hypothetical protein